MTTFQTVVFSPPEPDVDPHYDFKIHSQGDQVLYFVPWSSNGKTEGGLFYAPSLAAKEFAILNSGNIWRGGKIIGTLEDLEFLDRHVFDGRSEEAVQILESKISQATIQEEYMQSADNHTPDEEYKLSTLTPIEWGPNSEPPPRTTGATLTVENMTEVGWFRGKETTIRGKVLEMLNSNPHLGFDAQQVARALDIKQQPAESALQNHFHAGSIFATLKPDNIGYMYSATPFQNPRLRVKSRAKTSNKFTTKKDTSMHTPRDTRNPSSNLSLPEQILPVFMEKNRALSTMEVVHFMKLKKSPLSEDTIRTAIGNLRTEKKIIPDGEIMAMNAAKRLVKMTTYALTTKGAEFLSQRMKERAEARTEAKPETSEVRAKGKSTGGIRNPGAAPTFTIEQISPTEFKIKLL